MAKSTTPPRGIVFRTDPDTGHRSSSAAGRRILASAISGADPGAADRIATNGNWRHDYGEHFLHLTATGIASADTAHGIADRALAEARRQFEFAGETGSQPLDAAMAQPGEAFETATLSGETRSGPVPWTVPVGGEQLGGDRLRSQLDRWVHRGVMEASAAEALRRCVDHPEWFDLSDRTLVLLGAASEAGPLHWLAHWRANVVAVDIGSQAPWQRIIGEMRAGNGKLYAPVSAGNRGLSLEDGFAGGLGADLLTQTPEIARWLAGFGGNLDIGCLAYLDGERHARVSMAMDLIVTRICETNPDTTLAYMATPTDSFAVPESVVRKSINAYQNRPLLSRWLQKPLPRRFFQPGITRTYETDTGKAFGIADCTIPQQGPNYALAKRLQQWRAITARRAGHRVAMNIAPSTTTRSVLRNPALAAGFAGAGLFGVEVFAPETTNALMAAMWVHDLRYEGTSANPAMPLSHPFELYMDCAIHGGLWYVPYLPRTALPFAAAAGFVRNLVPGRR